MTYNELTLLITGLMSDNPFYWTPAFGPLNMALIQVNFSRLSYVRLYKISDIFTAQIIEIL